MSMGLGSLRWSDAAVASAFYDLLDTAPGLSGLVYCAALPDSQLAVILDWVNAVAEPDPAPAFSLDRLGKVMPALVVAYVASHTYAGLPARAPGDQRVDLEMTDLGCGTTVARALFSAARIAKGLHGAGGAELVRVAGNRRQKPAEIEKQKRIEAEKVPTELTTAIDRIHAALSGRPRRADRDRCARNSPSAAGRRAQQKG